MHGSSVLPNRKLQQARLSRHWSQKKLADKLGTDQQTVARWEGGKSRPGPYYRQRLCNVFALPEEALGLSGTEDVADRSSSTHDQEGTIDPFVPSPSFKLVGRDELLNKLKTRLFSSPTATISTLVGLPGVGKTTLATVLANDAAVRSHFPDGILWAGLGPHPNIFAHFIRWGTLLGINGENISSIEEWSMALRMAIRDRSFLLIIDDIWKAEEALALKVGGPRCCYVLTTRRVDIAIQVASQNEVMKVHELGIEESMAILEHIAPEATKNEKQALRELVDLLGGLPLALMLMGKYLESQSYSGHPRRIHAAIERLRDVETRLSLSAPSSLYEQNQGLKHAKPVSLRTVVAVSDEQVSEQAQRTLLALSIFPAKPNAFSEEAALAVSVQPADYIDELHDASLLESNWQGYYTMHQTIADYAFVQLRHLKEVETAVKQRFVAYFARFVQVHKTEYMAIEAEGVNIFAALDVAFEQKLFVHYVQIILDFAHYLTVKGMYTTAEYHLQRALEGINLDAVSHSEILNYLGIIAKKYGRLDEAENYHQRGLVLARQSKALILEIEHLARLGFLLSYKQQYIKAAATFQNALDRAYDVNDPMQLCTILNGLAMVQKETTNYAAAERYFLEGLDLAQSHGLIEREVTLLINYSITESLQGNAAQAEHIAQQALNKAQEHGLNESLTYLYNTLSDLAMDREDYKNAIDYSADCLALARKSGHVELIGGSLCTLGTAHGYLGEYNRAEAFFHEAFQVVPVAYFPLLHQEVRLRHGEVALFAGRFDQAKEAFQALISAEEVDIRIDALFGLARIFAIKGDLETARKYGQESLTLSRIVRQNLAPRILQWLEQLEIEEGHKS